MDINLTLTADQWSRTQAALKALGVSTNPTAAEAATWLKGTLEGIAVNYEKNDAYNKARAVATAAEKSF